MTIKKNPRNVRSRILEGRDGNCFMPATTVIENLDNNILGEILTRVPAKTLGGLKVINKRWYSLISDPFFINKHTTRSLQTTRDACNFFSKGSFGYITHLSLDRSSPHLIRTTNFFLEREFGVPIIHASCHGLLLVNLVAHVSKRFISTLCIFNPLTKDKKLIPSPYKRKCCRFGLVPTSSSSSSTLDYHYTVVCLVSAKTGFEFKIFMPKKERWRDFNKSTRISYGNGLKEDKPIHNPVCFRGIIHWLTEVGYIIAFNLDKEESRMIEIPKSVPQMVVKYAQWWYRTWLGVVKDEVNLVVVTPDYEIVTWVLHDYENNKWEIKRKYSIEMKRNPEFYVQPMFFDGDRFFLNIKSSRYLRNNYWHEYDVGTGVLSSLLPQAPQNSYLGINTLTKV